MFLRFTSGEMQPMPNDKYSFLEKCEDGVFDDGFAEALIMVCGQ